MAAVVLGGDTMGPERIFPNQTEELGPHQGPTEGTGDWSSEEPEEEQEETGAGPAGYSYQPLNQDPEQDEVELAPVGDGEDVVADIQDRIQALGLHLPDPPLESEDEEEEGATGLSNHSSIPMDPGKESILSFWNNDGGKGLVRPSKGKSRRNSRFLKQVCNLRFYRLQNPGKMLLCWTWVMGRLAWK
ncbi:male-enhanced antigen 1 isoform X3 [Ursus arctos]|nr:male-enhanced antigen 1 isoform X3 [Ursus arctos]XP_057159897.1 male-enhanced antigen 1 isoform X3 [Ursus arctos]XP_057159898.1 male-enhanced antigen 1 isoform X3 [Ursus arctos]